jgi:hypothetical protein
VGIADHEDIAGRVELNDGGERIPVAEGLGRSTSATCRAPAASAERATRTTTERTACTTTERPASTATERSAGAATRAAVETLASPAPRRPSDAGVLVISGWSSAAGERESKGDQQ